MIAIILAFSVGVVLTAALFIVMLWLNHLQKNPVTYINRFADNHLRESGEIFIPLSDDEEVAHSIFKKNASLNRDTTIKDFDGTDRRTSFIPYDTEYTDDDEGRENIL